ncbi:LysM domain protein [Sulfitobacter noctilucae]|uniref:LysM peptidoglycan-binding domain-containing protein n=1 Tax=Sulfitobacter noctilucae TaxID=1342302 RepID=UPI00046867B0|nr:LysM peptidoglycan-binding domain-containing protein [Sulfitobacter noctilucae]KIN75223.1 LysM domain protein [Sulfitobacter noctilucae]
MTKMEDPVTPTITFDSYVLPETVKQKPNTRAIVQARYQAIVERRAKAAADRQSIEEQPEPKSTPLRQRLQIALPAQGQAWLSRLPSGGPITAVVAIGVVTFALGVALALSIAGPQEVAGTRNNDAQSVTRQQSPDLTSTTALHQQEIATALSAEAAPQDKPQPLMAAQSILGSETMLALRAAVLAGSYTIAEKDAEGFGRLALTLNNGEASSLNADALLSAAAEQGALTIPASFSTPEGQMDADTMLFSLIQSALMQEATFASREAARQMSRRVFAASNATTQKINGQRTYAVRPGDSLAYIAMQFYGRPDAYTRILSANAEVLTSPTEIRTGQRLTIPQ